MHFEIETKTKTDMMAEIVQNKSWLNFHQPMLIWVWENHGSFFDWQGHTHKLGTIWHLTRI